MTERRFDPTLNEWRTYTAPWPDAAVDSDCRFCPTRDPQQPTDVPAEQYQLAVVDDPFPALGNNGTAPSVALDDFYRSKPARGASEIVLYSDQHGCGLADLDDTHVARLIDVLADRYAQLGARDDVEYVFFFQDGSLPGVTGAHPYGQLHGYPEIPPLMRRELRSAADHFEQRGTCLFCDVVAFERTDERRVVAQNESFLAFVPFAPRFPYEVHIYAQRHTTSLLDCTDPERLALARMVQAAVRAYQGAVGVDAPYALSMHQAPTDDGEWLGISHLHVEVTPLTQMDASQVGAGSYIGDSLPEDVAAQLRAALGKAEVPNAP